MLSPGDGVNSTLRDLLIDAPYFAPNIACYVRRSQSHSPMEDRFLGARGFAIMALDTGDIAHAKASFQSPPALHDDWNSIDKSCAGSDRPVR
jgi:hypothetical protein